jgi:hypothetical protein
MEISSSRRRDDTVSSCDGRRDVGDEWGFQTQSAVYTTTTKEMIERDPIALDWGSY